MYVLGQNMVIFWHFLKSFCQMSTKTSGNAVRTLAKIIWSGLYLNFRTSFIVKQQYWDEKKIQFLYYWEFLEIMGLVLKILLFQLTFLDAVIPIMEDPLYQRSHTSSTCQCILIIMRMFMCVLAVYIVLGNSFQHQIFMCMV